MCNLLWGHSKYCIFEECIQYTVHNRRAHTNTYDLRVAEQNFVQILCAILSIDLFQSVLNEFIISFYVSASELFMTKHNQIRIIC